MQQQHGKERNGELEICGYSQGAECQRSGDSVNSLVKIFRLQATQAPDEGPTTEDPGPCVRTVGPNGYGASKHRRPGSANRDHRWHTLRHNSEPSRRVGRQKKEPPLGYRIVNLPYSYIKISSNQQQQQRQRQQHKNQFQLKHQHQRQQQEQPQIITTLTTQTTSPSPLLAPAPPSLPPPVQNLPALVNFGNQSTTVTPSLQSNDNMTDNVCENERSVNNYSSNQQWLK
uniref:Uncharacterized protein n=1 Tax=Glossina pallidipes TaxID=7398 RepID=A0A1A9ZYU2_GLOPL